MIDARPALDLLVLLDDVAYRVWYSNPVAQKSVWLVDPKGIMKMVANDVVAVMPLAPADAFAFPPVKKVA